MIEINNKTFETQGDACKELGISLSTLRYGLDSGDINSFVNDFLEARDNGSNLGANPFFIDGKKYWKLSDASLETGQSIPMISLTLDSYPSRLITIEDILSTKGKAAKNYDFHTDLEDLVYKIEIGDIHPSEVVYNQRVSIREISKILGYYINMDKLILRPKLYRIFRRLVFLVEKRYPGGEGIKRCGRKYFYASDEDIVCKAAEYDSWSIICQKDRQLYLEVKGRELEVDIMRTNIRIAQHFYVGYGNIMYRSLPELVCGNLLNLNQINFDTEVKVDITREGSNKSMVSDFYFRDLDFHFEIAQNLKAARGSRQINYIRRNEVKKKLYEQRNLNFCFFDSEIYYDHGVLELDNYVNDLIDCLKGRGVEFWYTPKPSELLYQDDSEIKFLLSHTSSVEDIINYILNEKKISGMQELRNHYSYVVSSIKSRPDFDEIIRGIKDILSEKKKQHFVKLHDDRKKAGEPWKKKSKCSDFAQQNNLLNVPAVVSETGIAAWKVKEFARGNGVLKKFNTYLFSESDLKQLLASKYSQGSCQKEAV